MSLTTVSLTPDHLKKLAKLAIEDKRSKTQEIHHLIDEEMKRRGKN